jgi:hypothetical protein
LNRGHIAPFPCIALGIWPASHYALLPCPVELLPHAAEHVITQSQLLLFAAPAAAIAGWPHDEASLKQG